MRGPRQPPPSRQWRPRPRPEHTHKETPTKSPRTVGKLILEHPLNAGLGLFVAVGTVIGWVIAVYSPIFARPHDFETASYVLPFSIENRGLTSITHVRLSCGFDMVAYRDRLHRLYGVGQVIANSDVQIPEIKSNESINYPCNADGVLLVNADGSVSLGGLHSGPGAAIPPFEVVSMCAWIEAKYLALWFYPRTYVSQMFEWVQTPTGHVWLEGPLVSRNKTDLTQACLPRPGPPFMRLLGPGNQPLMQFKF
jgi:hypothetical protein